jgi:hypothetical protein
MEFNIADLQRQQLQLNMQNVTLQGTASRLQALPRISSIASGELRMIKQDPSNTEWIYPVVPHVSSSPPTGVSLGEAQRQSQPISWMSDFVSFVRSSL